MLWCPAPAAVLDRQRDHLDHFVSDTDLGPGDQCDAIENGHLAAAAAGCRLPAAAGGGRRAEGGGRRAHCCRERPPRVGILQSAMAAASKPSRVALRIQCCDTATWTAPHVNTSAPSAPEGREGAVSAVEGPWRGRGTRRRQRRCRIPSAVRSSSVSISCACGVNLLDPPPRVGRRVHRTRGEGVCSLGGMYAPR